MKSRDLMTRTGATWRDLDNYIQWRHVDYEAGDSPRRDFSPQDCVRIWTMAMFKGWIPPSTATRMGQAVFRFLEAKAVHSSHVIWITHDGDDFDAFQGEPPEDAIAFGLPTQKLVEFAEAAGMTIRRPLAAVG
jgi:hypothetical protein